MNNKRPVEEKTEAWSAFQTTHWSVVLKAGCETSPEGAEALERLCTAYWYPLYAYVRRKGHSPHDAQDLVQDFFARLLERNYVRLADRGRGRFRTFLLSSLQHFLTNEWHKANCIKRGGTCQVLSMDEETAEIRFGSELAIKQPPDSLYDRGWAATVIERALMKLQQEFAQSGKLDLFERLKPFAWGEKSGLPYSGIAEQIKTTEGAARVAIHRLRQRFGELVRSEIAQTVATPAEAEEELRHLSSAIRDGLTIAGNGPDTTL